MTIAEFTSWINTYIKKKITAPLMNTAFHKVLEYAAPIDDILEPYTDTIADIDLDNNKKLLVEHGKGTMVPDFIMFNEKGIQIFSEYYDALVVDEDTIEFTFYDDIPVTDLGHYKLAIWKICTDIEPRLTELLYCDFDQDENFNGILLDPLIDGQTAIVQDGNMILSSETVPVKFKLDCIVVPGRRYKLTIQLADGGLVQSGSSYTHTIFYTADQSRFSWEVIPYAGNTRITLAMWNSTTTRIDFIRLQEIS